jgi:hypothetical protein
MYLRIRIDPEDSEVAENELIELLLRSIGL